MLAKDLRETIEKIPLGQSITFPVSMINSVRSTASYVGLINDRKYATRTDRKARVITVTRKS